MSTSALPLVSASVTAAVATCQQPALSITELVLSAVHAVIDGRNNLQIMAQAGAVGQQVPVMYWHDLRNNALHICRHVPLDYHPSHFVAFQSSKALVSGVVQPERLTGLVLRNSSLIVQRSEEKPADESRLFRFPVLSRLQLCASRLTMREPLDTISAALSVGSHLVFTPGAVCNAVRLQFGDNNPDNAFSGTYHDSLVTEPEGSGKLDAARIPRPNRRRSTSPTTASHWTRQIPPQPCDAASNVCTICNVNRAVWTFTTCGHATLCSSCVGPSFSSNFINARKCPLCRTQGWPTPMSS